MSRGVVISALVATIAGAVLVGASSASAGVLCNVNESPCPVESTYEPGEFEALTTSKATIATNLGNITCSGGFVAQVSAVGGEGKPAEAGIEFFNFQECKEGKGLACSAAVKNQPYTASFEGSGGNGTMTLKDPTAVAFEFSCPFAPIQCTFSAASIGFNVTGGSPAVITATNVPLSRSGAQCPTTSTFSAEFKSAGAAFPSLFIVGGSAPPPVVRLCKQNVGLCLATQRHPIGTSIEGTLEGNSVFEFLYEGLPREPWCEGATLTGKTTQAAAPLIGEISAMTFKKCGAGVCAVQAQALPYKAEIEKTTGGNGTLAMVSGGSGSPKIEVNCGKAFKCIYKVSSVSFTLTGGEAPKLAVAKTLEKDAASEAECGSTMIWTATYKLTKPTPLFVTS